MKKNAWIVTFIADMILIISFIKKNNTLMDLLNYIWDNIIVIMLIAALTFTLVMAIYEIVIYIRKQFKKIDGLATYANVNKTEVEISSMLGRYIDEMRKEQTEFFTKLKELLDKHKISE